MRRAHVVALATAITLVPAASAEAAFTARGSVQQVQVTGAKKGSKLILMPTAIAWPSSAQASSAGRCSEI